MRNAGTVLDYIVGFFLNWVFFYQRAGTTTMRSITETAQE